MELPHFGTVNAVAMWANASYVLAGTQSGFLGGSILLFGRQGSVIWSYDTDRPIFSDAISADGLYVAAAGSQLLGASGFYSNGAIYFFSRTGALFCGGIPRGALRCFQS